MIHRQERNENISSENKEYDLTNLFERLAKSDFRSRFHLSKKDREYVMEKGLPTIRKHADDFVAKRLAPAVIPNDGKQTPMRGHPVFLAQPTPSREQYAVICRFPEMFTKEAGRIMLMI